MSVLSAGGLHAESCLPARTALEPDNPKPQQATNAKCTLLHSHL